MDAVVDALTAHASVLALAALVLGIYVCLVLVHRRHPHITVKPAFRSRPVATVEATAAALRRRHPPRADACASLESQRPDDEANYLQRVVLSFLRCSCLD